MWHLYRLASFSVYEVIFRVKQFVSNNLERAFAGKYSNKKIISYDPVLQISDDLINTLDCKMHARIFDKMISTEEIQNWSLDISTGKAFPIKFYQDINIRSEVYGTAKYVWEVNRMLYLPQLAIAFRKTQKQEYLDEIMRLLVSWKGNNPYLMGVNWYSNVEINIRLINWFLTWEILDGDRLVGGEPKFDRFCRETWFPLIYNHCLYSREHPSLYSSANNHLIAEYAGLFIASSKWKFPESDEWNKYALSGLEKELVKQYSKNGINREEAAEYIQFITDFYLISFLVAQKTANGFSALAIDRLNKIFGYINQFLDKKDNYPRYGDDDDGMVFDLFPPGPFNNFVSLLNAASIIFNNPEFKRVEQLDQKNHILFGEEGMRRFKALPAAVSPLKTVFYPAEGQIFLRNQFQGKEIFLHFDAAPLGYLSIAAHGHADALSFRLHLDGAEIFADPGTFCYHTQPEWRRYFTSTLAHNTITINQDNQAKFIGPTLWLNHYKVQTLNYGDSATLSWVKARHDGYKKYGIRHARRIEYNKQEGSFLIIDELTCTGSEEFNIILPFHFHPECKLDVAGSGELLIQRGENRIRLIPDQSLRWELIKGQEQPYKIGWYSPSFYNKEPACVFVGQAKFIPDEKSKNPNKYLVKTIIFI